MAVVNSASYQAGISEPGSLATIFCTGLTGVTGVVSPDTLTPLPLELAGVQVTVNFVRPRCLQSLTWAGECNRSISKFCWNGCWHN
jgi:uncharacterized protein (TIGR03437 family)